LSIEIVVTEERNAQPCQVFIEKDEDKLQTSKLKICKTADWGNTEISKSNPENKCSDRKPFLDFTILWLYEEI
jgi:hypothetical protein